MENSLSKLQEDVKNILKSIHRIEGKIFCNDPLMHQIWKQENIKENTSNINEPKKKDIE